MAESNSQRSPKTDDTGTDTTARGAKVQGSALENPPISALAHDIDSRDWDCLFSAVIDRLRSGVGARFAAERAARPQDAAAWVTACVLECSDALDQLHASLSYERIRSKKLKATVLEAQTSLAQARAELVGAQEREARARRLALHDDLTALPNRSFFRWQLDHALNQVEAPRKMLAVLYLDLDSFKPINDAHGHHAGDELLRIIADRLARSVGAENMVSRVGGDEFACLLAGAQSRENLSRLADDLLEAVSKPLNIGAVNVTVRPSIGIAVAPSDGATSEALLKNADLAMYTAKRRRSGYAFFSDCGSS